VRRNLALFYRFRLSPSKISEYGAVDPPRRPVAGHGLSAGGNWIEAEDVMRYVRHLMISLALCAATLAAAESPTIEFAPHSERFSLSTTLAVISAINRLGSDNYDVREAASQSLRDIGRGARKLLEAGSRLPDLEISQRCRQLLHDVDIMTALFNLRSKNEKVRVAAFQILHKEGKAVREQVELSLQSGNTESQFLCRELLRLM
jgi:hypothetical protein